MTLRLAVSNIAWEPREDDAVATMLRERGVTGVEIAPTKRWEKPLEASKSELLAYRREWEARGLEIVALQALLFGRPDLQLFAPGDALRDYLIGIIGVGEALGAKALVFGSPKNRVRGDMAFDRAVAAAAEFFHSLAHTAHDAGTAICFEPNPPEYGCDFITTVDEAVTLSRFVHHAGFRVQGDLGALEFEQQAHPGARELAEKIRRAAPYFGHFHISEPNLVEIGTGDADVAGAMRGLASSSYRGWVSIEMKQTDTAGVGRALDVVRRYLPAAPT